MSDDLKSDIDGIVAGLMKKYKASHNDAVEATHQAFANIQGKNYEPRNKFNYWFTAAKHEYFDMQKKQKKRRNELKEHHLPPDEQPSLHEKFQSRRLDRLVNKLNEKEWVLLEMIRHGFSNKIIGEAFEWESSTVRTRKCELIKKVKALIIFLLVAFPAFGQVSTTLEQGGLYFVVVDEDTISQHLRLDKAIESGSKTGGDFRVVQDFRLNVRNQYVDNVLITQTGPMPGESEILHSVMVEHRQSEPGVHRIRALWESTSPVNEMGWRCIDNIPSGPPQPLQASYSTSEPADDKEYRWQTDCNSILHVSVTAHQFDWAVRKDEYLNTGLLDSLFTIDIPQPEENRYFTDFSDYNPEEWVNTWGQIYHTVENETLYLEIEPRNISRFQWNRIPLHQDVRFRIVETLHESHGAGIHAGARSSPEAREYAVESYIHGPGLGVSLFNGGAWSNPESLPFQWEHGMTVEYITEVIGGKMRMKAWEYGQPAPEQWYEYESELIANTPPGYFMIGGTGAGLYIIHEIEVEILD